MGQKHSNLTIYSDEIPLTAKPGQSPHYKSHKTFQPDPTIDSISTPTELFTYMANRLPNFNCLGTREKLPNNTFGSYKWQTYSQVLQRCKKLGSNLKSHKLVTRSASGHLFIGIHSATSIEWTILDLACMFNNIVSVPIYDSLQPDALEYIINQTGMKAVAATAKNVESILKLAEEGKIPELEVVIALEECLKDEERLKKAGLKLFGLWEVEEMEVTGEENVDQEEIFTICYTSGTTGMGKGAIITHSNLLASCKAAYLKKNFEVGNVYFSFLPMAHIMERTAVHHMFALGASVGFYHGDIFRITDDIAVLKPTFFVSVPRLLMRFYDIIKVLIATEGGIRGKLKRKALQIKWARYKTDGNIVHSFFDKLCFRGVRAMLGGRVAYMATGSAPISAEVLGFLRIVFSSSIFEGYGQTETTAGILFTDLADVFNNNNVGGPNPELLLKIVDVPEMHYLTTDHDSLGNPTPRGELCVKGPFVFKGYFKNPEKTVEAFDDEGWLKTGDVVQRNFWNGSFTIIDRKSNCFKLQQGEYVAAEKVQLYYQKSSFVLQCFVDGNSMERYPVAVVVPNEEFIRKVWKNEVGLNLEMGMEELCRVKEFKKVILEDMEKVAEENGLLGYERVKNIYLESKMWTPADLLTPTMKLKRFEAKNKYREIVNQLYTCG